MSSLDPKKIVLVHPLGYPPEEAGRDISRLTHITPPAGLASIAAWLEKHGFQVHLMDCYARPRTDREIVEFLADQRPGFLGLSCTTSIFNDGIRVSRLAKSAFPDIRVVFGGTHVSALRERILADFPVVDFVVVGEGEETMRALMESGGASVSAIQGLVYRERGGGIVFSGYRDVNSLDLDRLPFPAYEKLAGFPKAYFLPPFSYPSAPHSTCVSSRGCPYSCSYCDRSVFQRGFRYNSAGYVYEHLRHLKERFGIRHVLFQDDQFTYDRKRIEELTKRLTDRPLGMTFSCAVRAEHTDEELLRGMKAAGCWMVSLGIETGDEDLLAQHRKNPDLQFLADRVRLIRRIGIRVKGLLMMGLPGETEASIRKSMEYVYSLSLDELNIARFTPFPGSPLYERVRDLGEFEEDWDKMDCLHFQFIPRGMEKGQLERLFTEFYRGYFLRPGTLRKYMKMIWQSPDSYRRFFLNAADFVRFARGGARRGASRR